MNNPRLAISHVHDLMVSIPEEGSDEMATGQAIIAEEKNQLAEALEFHQELCVKSNPVINQETLAEVGTEDMANKIVGSYEEHGMYVDEEAVISELGVDKEVGPVQQLEWRAHQLLMAILSFTEKPIGFFRDIIGLDDVKDVLAQQWMLPEKFPNFFTGNRRPWDSILIYGLPGTGKSTLANILAAEIGARFISVLGHQLRCNNWRESEEYIRNLFVLAKEKAPTVLLIDEIEGLFPNSTCQQDYDLTTKICSALFDQIKLLAQSPKAVIVLGATNEPNTMDNVALNKFEKLVYLNLPDIDERAHIFRREMVKVQHVLTQSDFEALAERTFGYSGADIIKVIRNARMTPLCEVASALQFKKIEAPSKMEENGIKTFWTACDVQDGMGFPMTWKDIPNAEDLIIPKITLNMIFQSIIRVKPTSTGISMEKVDIFRRGLLNEYVIHDTNNRDLNLLRENRKWYDFFLECFVG